MQVLGFIFVIKMKSSLNTHSRNNWSKYGPCSNVAGGINQWTFVTDLYQFYSKEKMQAANNDQQWFRPTSRPEKLTNWAFVEHFLLVLSSVRHVENWYRLARRPCNEKNLICETCDWNKVWDWSFNWPREMTDYCTLCAHAPNKIARLS